jgi:hypothetical protein
MAVGADGAVWVVELNNSSSTPPRGTASFAFALRGWDGDEWTAYGPVEVELKIPQEVPASFLSSLLGGRMDARFLDDGSVWFLDGLLVLDADGLRSQELPGAGDLVFGPDGSAWSVAEGGLYVITPEAVAGAE